MMTLTEMSPRVAFLGDRLAVLLRDDGVHVALVVVRVCYQEVEELCRTSFGKRSLSGLTERDAPERRSKSHPAFSAEQPEKIN